MPAEPGLLALAAEFPAPNRDEWRALVARVLERSGLDSAEDPENALAYTTYDGIRIAPLYMSDDVAALPGTGLPGEVPFVRGATRDGATRSGWDVRTRHADPDPARANAAVLTDLERGATSLWLAVGDDAIQVDGLAAALEGVYLDLAPVVLDAGRHWREAATQLLDLADERGVDRAALRGSLGLDPIGARARTGADAVLADLGDAVELAGAVPGLRIATVDGTVFHDAGASDAQELGIATAVGVTYLRALTDARLSVDDALRALEFRWAVTAEQFPSIAKLRAARRVWDRVAGLCGASDERRGQLQHAVTSAAMLTRRDPWVNMLRTTIACFAASAGGADAITVAPFDSAIGMSDDFARRIARNTHAVLHDESSLARVTDAAGGSWFVESLTDQLADAAWTVFTDIEKNGGVLARLDDGTVEKFLAQTRTARDADIAHRRSPITGVSEYAFVGEKVVDRPSARGVPDGLLPRLRYAEKYELLRDRADAASSRPKIFLATLGDGSAYRARVAFAANLFQAAGLECVEGPVDEFAGAGTTVACLCSSDDVYRAEAATAAKALHDAGASLVWLAGKVDVDGVDGTVFAGCDALAALSRTMDAIEGTES
jgi:methylmalonyl-CoA mutase